MTDLIPIAAVLVVASVMLLLAIVYIYRTAVRVMNPIVTALFIILCAIEVLMISSAVFCLLGVAGFFG
jgi:hypothetical protein